MRPNRVYLLHPGSRHIPDIADWIAEVEALLESDPSWDNWEIHRTQYNETNGFDVQPVYVRVLHRPGPILLIEPVQSKPLADLQNKLLAHVVVLPRSLSDSTELWDAVMEAKNRHKEGEPLLPRKLVVAILIVRKLRDGNYWAGNSKGYLWHFDLAKGRGVDERFRDVALEVADALLLHQVLTSKTSKGQTKYALNPKRKAEVHAIADRGTFENDRLRKILSRDYQRESAEYLQQPFNAIFFTVAYPEQSYNYLTATDAINHVKNQPDGVQCDVEVEFQNGRIIRENFAERRVLLQFLEAFQ